jgi:hypothetical protein
MSYDVDPKSERFLMIRPANSSEISAITSLHVVLNWFTDLRAKMKEAGSGGACDFHGDVVFDSR